MNRYPVWKYIVLVFAIVIGMMYAVPNIYAPDPALQIAGKSSGLELPQTLIKRIEARLTQENIAYFGVNLSGDKRTLLLRFEDADKQLEAKSLIQSVLGDDFVVALNMASTTPKWLHSKGAQSMKLGLDLSGGVHFLLEVDTETVIQSRLEALKTQTPALLRENKIRYRNLALNGNEVEVAFRTDDDRTRAKSVLREQFGEISIREFEADNLYSIGIAYLEQDLKTIEERAVSQNITALRNRVNELGVSEPLVQRQGRNRIIVQLPGIQDTAEAKRIIGKTANLEFRLEYSPDKPKARERFDFKDSNGPYPNADLEKDIIVTGDFVSDAATGFDENGAPQVSITLNSEGGKKMHRSTRNNIGRRMGILFIEYKSKIIESVNESGQLEQKVESYAEKSIISLATIQSALGVNFRITGVGSQSEASELALLLRAGALAAPMVFVEERTVGPSLGAKNVNAGMLSIQIGIALVLLFMLVYYRAFGVIANIALVLNLVLLTACMSIIGATLTLPGIAGIVLTLGMSVDANVLIFARIREELKNGSSPQIAIDSGYERAYSTIMDANITTLFVAIILYLIGSGPIQGFAITLSIGILTSMFTAIFASRAMVNLFYGSRNKLEKISI